MRYSIAEIERRYKSDDKLSREIVRRAVPDLIKEVRRLRRARNVAHKKLRRLSGN